MQMEASRNRLKEKTHSEEAGTGFKNKYLFLILSKQSLVVYS